MPLRVTNETTPQSIIENDAFSERAAPESATDKQGFIE
jgi:hypothetical protein